LYASAFCDIDAGRNKYSKLCQVLKPQMGGFSGWHEPCEVLLQKADPWRLEHLVKRRVFPEYACGIFAGACWRALPL
jgi:hypothetical protein